MTERGDAKRKREAVMGDHRLEPALTADDAGYLDGRFEGLDPARKAERACSEIMSEIADEASGEIAGWRPAANFARVMALANHALPESDPRKLTFMTVLQLRRVVMALEELGGTGETLDELNRAADAIESLLPPDTSENRSGVR